MGLCVLCFVDFAGLCSCALALWSTADGLLVVKQSGVVAISRLEPLIGDGDKGKRGNGAIRYLRVTCNFNDHTLSPSL